MKTGTGLGLLLLSLVDHLTELPIVQLVVATRIELLEGRLDLLICQIFADCHKFLQ